MMPCRYSRYDDGPWTPRYDKGPWKAINNDDRRVCRYNEGFPPPRYGDYQPRHTSSTYWTQPSSDPPPPFNNNGRTASRYNDDFPPPRYDDYQPRYASRTSRSQLPSDPPPSPYNERPFQHRSEREPYDRVDVQPLRRSRPYSRGDSSRCTWMKQTTEYVSRDLTSGSNDRGKGKGRRRKRERSFGHQRDRYTPQTRGTTPSEARGIDVHEDTSKTQTSVIDPHESPRSRGLTRICDSLGKSSTDTEQQNGQPSLGTRSDASRENSVHRERLNGQTLLVDSSPVTTGLETPAPVSLVDQCPETTSCLQITPFSSEGQEHVEATLLTKNSPLLVRLLSENVPPSTPSLAQTAEPVLASPQSPARSSEERQARQDVLTSPPATTTNPTDIIMPNFLGLEIPVRNSVFIPVTTSSALGLGVARTPSPAVAQNSSSVSAIGSLTTCTAHGSSSSVPGIPANDSGPLPSCSLSRPGNPVTYSGIIQYCREESRTLTSRSARDSPLVARQGTAESALNGTSDMTRLSSWHRPSAWGDSSGHQSTGHRPSGHQSTGHTPSGHQSTGHTPSGYQSTRCRPSGHQSTVHQLSEHQSTGCQPSEYQSTGLQSLESYKHQLNGAVEGWGTSNGQEMIEDHGSKTVDHEMVEGHGWKNGDEEIVEGHGWKIGDQVMVEGHGWKFGDQEMVHNHLPFLDHKSYNHGQPNFLDDKSPNHKPSNGCEPCQLSFEGQSVQCQSEYGHQDPSEKMPRNQLSMGQQTHKCQLPTFLEQQASENQTSPQNTSDAQRLNVCGVVERSETAPADHKNDPYFVKENKWRLLLKNASICCFVCSAHFDSIDDLNEHLDEHNTSMDCDPVEWGAYYQPITPPSSSDSASPALPTDGSGDISRKLENGAHIPFPVSESKSSKSKSRGEKRKTSDSNDKNRNDINKKTSQSKDKKRETAEYDENVPEKKTLESSDSFTKKKRRGGHCPPANTRPESPRNMRVEFLTRNCAACLTFREQCCKCAGNETRDPSARDEPSTECSTSADKVLDKSGKLATDGDKSSAEMSIKSSKPTAGEKLHCPADIKLSSEASTSANVQKLNSTISEKSTKIAAEKNRHSSTSSSDKKRCLSSSSTSSSDRKLHPSSSTSSSDKTRRSSNSSKSSGGKERRTSSSPTSSSDNGRHSSNSSTCSSDINRYTSSSSTSLSDKKGRSSNSSTYSLDEKRHSSNFSKSSSGEAPHTSSSTTSSSDKRRHTSSSSTSSSDKESHSSNSSTSLSERKHHTSSSSTSLSDKRHSSRSSTSSSDIKRHTSSSGTSSPDKKRDSAGSSDKTQTDHSRSAANESEDSSPIKEKHSSNFNKPVSPQTDPSGDHLSPETPVNGSASGQSDPPSELVSPEMAVNGSHVSSEEVSPPESGIFSQANPNFLKAFTELLDKGFKGYKANMVFSTPSRTGSKENAVSDTTKKQPESRSSADENETGKISLESEKKKSSGSGEKRPRLPEASSSPEETHKRWKVDDKVDERVNDKGRELISETRADLTSESVSAQKVIRPTSARVPLGLVYLNTIHPQRLRRTRGLAPFDTRPLSRMQVQRQNRTRSDHQSQVRVILRRVRQLKSQDLRMSTLFVRLTKSQMSIQGRSIRATPQRHVKVKPLSLRKVKLWRRKTEPPYHSVRWISRFTRSL